jgi:hypothetical protein
MFTKPTLTPVAGFTEGLANRNNGSLLRAAWLNYVSNNYPNALDAIGGGYYQLAGSDLRISSDTRAIKINSPAVGQPTSLLGFVRIGVTDDVNYAVGVGNLIVSSAATFSAATTFSAGVTFTGAITYSNTVAFNGAVTINAATTFTSNGDVTLQSGCAVTGESGSSLTMQDGTTTTLDVVNVNDTMTVATGKNIVLNGTSEVIFDAPRSYDATIKGVLGYDDSEWTNGSVFFEQTTPPPLLSPTSIKYVMDVPSEATITEIHVRIDPAAGHGALPSSMPSIALVEVNPADGTSVTITTVSDTSADVVAYEPAKDLSATGLSHATTAGRYVVCAVFGEGGPDEVAGLRAYAPRIKFTRAGIM